MRPGKLFASLLAAAALVGSGGLGAARGAPPRILPRPFVLRTSTDALLTLPPRHRARVLLYFWVSWDPADRRGLLRLPALARSLSAFPVAVDLTTEESSTEDVLRFLAHHPVPFPVALDLGGRLADALQVTALPAVVLLSRGGRILLGPIPLSSLPLRSAPRRAR